MRMQFEWPAGVSLWIAGVALCLLVATGVVARAYSIPASSPGNAAAGTRAGQATASIRTEDADPVDREAAGDRAPATGERRSRASCPECGVVESVRQVDHYVNAGRHDAALAMGGTPTTGRAGASAPTTETSYEVTVRLRDGRKTTFTEPTPRAWRSGARVVVIAGFAASND